MTDMARTDELRARHAELDRLLEEEQARPMPDSGILSDLKRRKLALKDQIASAEGAVDA